MTSPAEIILVEEEANVLVEPLLPSDHRTPSPSPEPQVTWEDEPLIEEDWDHGEVQEAVCQDKIFAVAFLLQFIGMVVLAVLGLQEMTADADFFEDFEITIDVNGHDAEMDLDSGRYILFHAIVAATSIGWGIGALLLYGACAETMVQISLLVSPFVCFALALWSFIASSIALGVILLVIGLFGSFFAYSNWYRVPFAAANLVAGMTAVRKNFGLVFLSFLTVIKTWLWISTAGFALVYLYHHAGCHEECDQHTSVSDSADLTGDSIEVDCEQKCKHVELYALLWFLSYCWTYGVLKYMLHTNVAGVVGSWWFVPQEASACCSQALCDSMYRTSVYSFGSICFGSLVLSITQVLEAVVRMARLDNERRRENNEGGSAGASVLFCLLECLVQQLQRLVQYINKWAFVYVGIYGFDYMTAGSKVYALFQARGWSVVLNDVLVARSLQIITLLVSVCTGVTSVLLYILVPTWWDGVPEDSEPSHDMIDADHTIFAMHHCRSCWITFAVGCIYGALLSSVVLKVVSSAVETVIVCFAENPNALRENHPEHSRSMTQAWRKVYPEEFGN